MLNRLKSFFDSNKISIQDSKILVAVSGGKDSMALLHGLKNLGISVAAAHCNFQLRGEDSDLDEKTVVEFCKIHEIPCYTQRFETTKLLENSKSSIQMLARALRYDFFNELMETHKFDYLATAHHALDNFENFFIYLHRNNVQKGWLGISSISDNLIRPNISTSPAEIYTYLQEHNIAWREDVSNASTKYLRNKVRHWIVTPLFAEFPELIQEFQAIQKLAQEVYKKKLDAYAEFIDQHILFDEKDNWKTNKTTINSELLLRWFYEFGFNKTDIPNIIKAHTGSVFKHQLGALNIERNQFAFYYHNNNQTEISNTKINLNSPNIINTAIGEFTIEVVATSDWNGEYLSSNYYFDAALLGQELELRTWQTGDKIRVFGLNKTKKLSDIFTDSKIERNLKDQYPILLHQGEILAVLGLKRSALAPVTDLTKELLIVALLS